MNQPLTFQDFGIWPKLHPIKSLTTNELQGKIEPMPEELKLSQEQWEQMLAAQMAKQSTKTPTRATVPATKPYKEKSFVSVHYNALGEHKDEDTTYGSRDPQTYVVLHFYLRPGDTWIALQNDATMYRRQFPNCKLIVHDHSWDSPCSPSPKLRKCKEV